MAEGGKAPDLNQIIRELIFKYFGRASVLLLVVLYLFRNWGTVNKWPGIAYVVSHFTRW